jgi:hypothetical protein
MATQKGLYTPINREKYVGRWPIKFRSSWEYAFMRRLDLSDHVLEWSSESLSIAYFNPVKGKPTRYFPDFLIKYKDGNGGFYFEVVEVKPYKQTIRPVATKGKRQKTILTEQTTWMVNVAKWEAAVKYCTDRGFRFKILTEKNLFN